MDWESEYEQYEACDWPTDVEGTVRLALVGLGGFTREWVVPAVEATDHATVSALVSGSPSKANELAADCGADATLSYEEFVDGVARDAYDAAYVATPNATHLEYVRAALDHGRAVLCEKPMTATVEEAERLADRAASADAPVMVAYRMQAHPVVRWARSLVAEGILGEPIHARGTMSQPIFEMVSPSPEQWRLNAELSGGAAMNDLGIYPMNTTRFVTGADPTRVAATTRSPSESFDDVDEHAGFLVEYEGGLVGAFTASQNAAKTSDLHVTGTEGDLRIEPAFFGGTTLRVDTDRVTATVESDGPNEIRRTFEYFATHVLRGARPEPDAEHGLVDMRALDAAYRAADEAVWVDLD
jgi:xylose dehydrogenase (NAD/NADP)